MNQKKYLWNHFTYQTVIYTFLLKASMASTPPNELIDAVEQGDVVQVRALLSEGADVNQTNNAGMTPIYAATCLERMDIMRFLVDSGANINQANIYGVTPLSIASYCGYMAFVSALISEGADVNQANKNGVTPLHRASKKEHTAIVAILKAAGVR